jgi:hypothetical protein
LNGGKIGSGWVDEANTVANQVSPLTLQSTLNLKKGDQVWVEIYAMTTAYSTQVLVYLYDDTNHFTHFTGFMLEEDIVASP